MAYRRPAGCYFWQPLQSYGTWMQLPMLECKAHTVIKGSATRTRLKQYYNNVSSSEIEKCQYAFPLYDGVSVVGFKCQIGGKVLQGIVKEREQAKQEFDKAVAAGESAGLMEQSLSASDVFTTSLGNVPKGSTAIVTIEYVTELKHDLESDSLKFEMPTGIAPRYGGSAETSNAHQYPCAVELLPASRGFEWTCDIQSPTAITKVESPTHAVSITLGQLSTEAETDEPDFKKCSAKMTLPKESGLSKELILTVKSKGIKDPVALWETHPEVPNHSALMTTLVPNFSLPQIKPEVIFVCDRSGSMQGDSIKTLVDALRVMLHSLPANGIKFNICSFGSSYSFLFKKSQSYSRETLKQATEHLNTFDADYGGTETEKAIRATIEQRYGDIPLEIILLTDGDIWSQESLFTYLNEKVAESKKQIRVFPLGIGHGVSSALIEGVARAGNGFASTVMPGERMDQRCMRMLKAALSPHITNYKLEVVYEKDGDDEFEMVERVHGATELAVRGKAPRENSSKRRSITKKIISLFDSSANADDTKMADAAANQPKLNAPTVLQAPFEMPPLYSFARSTVYLLLGPESAHRVPKSVILKGSLDDNELRLEVPVINTGSFRTIHQLAARRAVQDLEEGRGWPFAATTEDGKSLREAHPSSFDDIVKAEAVRLGTTFQVMNRWCSYVARERAARESPRFELDTQSIEFANITADDKKAKSDKMETDEQPVANDGVAASADDYPASTSKSDTIEESSDEDMGFDLFDDSTSTLVPVGPPSTSNTVGSGSGRSSAGAAPRRQLASKAARMAAPVSYTPWSNVALSFASADSARSAFAPGGPPSPSDHYGAYPSMAASSPLQQQGMDSRQTGRNWMSSQQSASLFGGPSVVQNPGYGSVFSAEASIPSYGGATPCLSSNSLDNIPVGYTPTTFETPNPFGSHGGAMQARQASSRRVEQKFGGAETSSIHSAFQNATPNSHNPSSFENAATGIPTMERMGMLFSGNVPVLQQHQAIQKASAPSLNLFGGSAISSSSQPAPPPYPGASAPTRGGGGPMKKRKMAGRGGFSAGRNRAVDTGSSFLRSVAASAPADEEMLDDDNGEEEDGDDNATASTSIPSFPDDAARVRFLISLQEFDGSFETKGKGQATRLAAVLDIAEEKVTTDSGVKGADETVWATVLVLAYLEENMRAEKEVWEMSAEKARAWLDGLAGEKGFEVGVLMERAATVLKLRARKAA